MRHVSDRFAVVLDANVLYPFLTRDVLLSLAHAGLYRPLWSAEITLEWKRHLIERKPKKAGQIDQTARLMEEQFPEALVEGYESLIPALTLPDPGDRHVLAAAIRGGAQAIITENLRDFPKERLAAYDIEVNTADEFCLSTIQLYLPDAIQAIHVMRRRYVAPPMTPAELLISLNACGLVRTAAELQSHATFL
jgi:predicted nucleic acid-binding protein